MLYLDVIQVNKWAQDFVKTQCQVMDVSHIITLDSDDENQVWCVFSLGLNKEGAKIHSFFWKAWPKWRGQNQVSL